MWDFSIVLEKKREVMEEVRPLLEQRSALRKNRKFKEADVIRKDIMERYGGIVHDEMNCTWVYFPWVADLQLLREKFPDTYEEYIDLETQLVEKGISKDEFYSRLDRKVDQV